MTASEAEEYINRFNKKARPIARVVHEALLSSGCTPYVKTIYVGYDLDGKMVAASYIHEDSVEVALALDERHSDDRLVDASHLKWRTLPLALILSTVGDAEESKALLAEACERVASETHEVHRDNDFFLSRAGRHPRSRN